eukprot:CAMPEP_0198566690 /NCGR_PEP_ID=MMETSP1462-20131121/103663_1 /TAXON_ID=1333877 /ORGANISM="Brandtodinium nutriculum, Strain RCC3387" /LENGTH=110 /DNA_ID=CAMNT_0044297725 /DNA_START=30 /DNA_END=358 /DNA_ORIENTATION=-
MGALVLPVRLHELEELQVVLVLGPDQLIHVDVSLDAVLVERGLQHLVIRHELVVGPGHPVHPFHRDRVLVARVNNLAIHRAARALLHLGQVRLQQVVHPSQQLRPRHEKG